MPRVTCRCGEKLKVPTESVQTLQCGRCGAKIRLRKAPDGSPLDGDGYIRFLCPCGRRLKVPAEDRPKAGRCPDCGRIVPVPTSKAVGVSPNLAKNDSETRTQDLDTNDLAELKKWADRYVADSDQAEGDAASPEFGSAAGPRTDDFGLPSGNMPRASVVKFETGLRICPHCQKPLHLGADHCRACGTLVPRQ